VKERWAAILVVIKERVLAVPDKLAPELTALNDERQVRDNLKREMHTILKAIHEDPLEDYVFPSGERASRTGACPYGLDRRDVTTSGWISSQEGGWAIHARTASGALARPSSSQTDAGTATRSYSAGRTSTS
jgi:hypothetical protein